MHGKLLSLFFTKFIVNTTHITDQLKTVLEEGSDSVVLYRLPFKKKKILHVGNAKYLTDLNNELLSDTSFIIHPFQSKKFPIVKVDQQFKDVLEGEFDDDITNLLIPLFKKYLQEDNVLATQFEEYRQQFNKMYDALSAGSLNKVILSKIKLADRIDATSIIPLFNELSSLYEHAFVYALVTPETGVWIGAGPELLLKKEQECLHTVSLAGTLPSKDDAEWGHKELDEQGLVTAYMEEVLMRNYITNYSKKGPYTIKAGQVCHLKTDFHFKLNNLNGEVTELLSQLHPTPAVCGMPKELAFDVISKTESNRREYYAGFLGPVDNGDFSFFVNIRCMKVTRSKAALFIGGGLTLGSEVNKEWDETELKAQTLLSVMKNVANLQGYE